MGNSIKNALEQYKKACNYLKQINSDKAKKYKKYHNLLMISTLVFTIILAAIGFSDDQEISSFFALEPKRYTFLLSFLALMVLIISLLNQLFRFHEKSIEHYQTVTTLACLMRDIESLKLLEEDELKREFELFNVRYNTILMYLPHHSDKDFIKAKISLKRKQEISQSISNSNIHKWILQIIIFYKGLLHLKKDDRDNNE